MYFLRTGFHVHRKTKGCFLTQVRVSWSNSSCAPQDCSRGWPSTQIMYTRGSLTVIIIIIIIIIIMIIVHADYIHPGVFYCNGKFDIRFFQSTGKKLCYLMVDWARIS